MKQLNQYPIKIESMGIYLPPNIVDINTMLKEEKIDKQLLERLGIRERHVVINETHSVMALKAAKEAFAHSSIQPEDLDLIINTSETIEKMMPDGATMLQNNLGIGDSGIPCITLQNGELGFMTALDVCMSYFATNRFRNILLIDSEIYSVLLDKNHDVNSYATFSDGAVAMILTPSKEGEVSCMYDGLFKNRVNSSAILSNFSLDKLSEDIDRSTLCISLNSEELTEVGIELLEEMLEKYPSENINLVVPQQINQIVWDGVECLFDEKLLYKEYENYGYCGSASIPLAMYHAIKSNRLQRGDNILLVGIGSGVSNGLIKLTY